MNDPVQKGARWLSPRRLCLVFVGLLSALVIGLASLGPFGGTEDAPPPGWLNTANGWRIDIYPYYNLRMVTSALDQFFIEEDASVAREADIYGPDRYIKTKRPEADWSESFPFRRGGRRLVCRNRDGLRFYFLWDRSGGHDNWLVRNSSGNIIYQRGTLSPADLAVLDGGIPGAPPDGVRVITYDLGQRRTVETISGGVREGPLLSYAEDGRLIERSNYRGGVLLPAAEDPQPVPAEAAAPPPAAPPSPPAGAAAGDPRLASARTRLGEAEAARARGDHARADAALAASASAVLEVLREDRAHPERLLLLARVHLAGTVDERWPNLLEADFGLFEPPPRPGEGRSGAGGWTALDIDRHTLWRGRVGNPRKLPGLRGRALAACSLSREALELDPNRREAREILVEAALVLSRFDAIGKGTRADYSLEWAQEAVAAASRVSADHPGDAAARGLLVRCRRHLAHRQLRDLRRSYSYNAKETAPARATLDALAADLAEPGPQPLAPGDPRAIPWRAWRAEVGLLRGRLEAKVGRDEAAAAHLRDAGEHLGEDLADDALRWVAFQLAYARADLDAGEAAASHYREAIALAPGPDARSARGREWIYYLALCHRRCAGALELAAAPGPALEHYQRSAELFEMLHRRAPSAVAFLLGLSDAHHQAGDHFRRRQLWAEAKEAFNQEIARLRSLSGPTSLVGREMRRRLGPARVGLADAELALGNRDAGLARLAEAIGPLRDSKMSSSAAAVRQRLGREALSQGRREGAVEAFEQAVDLCRRAQGEGNREAHPAELLLRHAQAYEQLAGAIAQAYGEADPRVAATRQDALATLDKLTSWAQRGSVPRRVNEAATALRASIGEALPAKPSTRP